VQIEKNTMVKFEFVMRDQNDSIIEASDTDAPPEYVHGYNILIPGLEEALDGKTEGDAFSVSIPPEKAYGLHNSEMLAIVPKKEIPMDYEYYEGAFFDAVNENGETIKLRVKEITETDVILDGNHFLAGQTLKYQISIMETREATKEEIEAAKRGTPAMMN